MMILFDGSVVLFHSDPDLYLKEKSGLKRNIVRLIDMGDFHRFKDLTHIRISESDGDSNSFFTRYISDISEVGELLGKKMFVFSWDSDKDV